MASRNPQIFLSYSGEDGFEASLLQFAIEQLLIDLHAKVWTYQRDQRKDQQGISRSLQERVRQSQAMVFLMSPSTLSSGAAQWMELAYADAYEVPTFVLLHRMTFTELKGRDKGVPPLLLESQCNASIEWKSVVTAMRSRLVRSKRSRT